MNAVATGDPRRLPDPGSASNPSCVVPDLAERVGMTVTHPRSGGRVGQQAKLRSQCHVLAVTDVIEAAGCQKGLTPDRTEVLPPIGHSGGKVFAADGVPVEGPTVCPWVLGVRDCDFPCISADAQPRKDRLTQEFKAVALEDKVGI